jgi:hypothetical protein
LTFWIDDNPCHFWFCFDFFGGIHSIGVAVVDDVVVVVVVDVVYDDV